MWKLLLKKQMLEVFRSYFYDAKKNRKRSTVGVIAYFILFALIMVGVLGGMFSGLSILLCEDLYLAGVAWLYYVILGLIAVFLGVFGSVFNTYSGLYLAKDNELLLSMPIPVKDILISRLANVYLLGLMYSAMVDVPAVIVYWIFAERSAESIVGGIAFILFISVFVMVLSCVLGYVVARISVKLKNKSFITVLLSIAFIALYYFVYFRAMNMITELVQNAVFYGEKLKGASRLLYEFGRIGEGSWGAVIGSAVFSVVLTIAVVSVLSRSFWKLAISGGSSAQKRKLRAQKPKSLFTALLGKELGRFTASPGYMLNCGLGILMLPVLGVMLLFKGDVVIGTLNEFFAAQQGSTIVLITAALCMAATMNDMTAPSVSLEGKNLWLLQSLPVSPKTVLYAKLTMQLLLTELPLLFCICCLYVILPGGPEFWLMVLVVMLTALLFALVGLYFGLVMPNLAWTNEIFVIKQSANVAIALFGGWAYAAAIGGIYLWVGYLLGAVRYLAAAALITAILSGILFRWISTRGAERFAKL